MNDLIEQLNNAELHKFSNWKNNDIPKVCAGVYAIYDTDEEFIYIGMAGAELNDEKIKAKGKANKKSGLKDRLGSHATGYRSGDRFNIYIGDLYVLGTLTQLDIKSISNRENTFDSHIKTYIHKNLSYRYLITPHHVVRELEKHIQVHGINSELPSINAKK